jgi:ABC-type bacteriocin/lantibiotic exporter with double-glycine peptidase domain
MRKRNAVIYKTFCLHIIRFVLSVGSTLVLSHARVGEKTSSLNRIWLHCCLTPFPRSIINTGDFEIQEGALTVIKGPVGCAKSTLLYGLLNEVPHNSGQI